MLAKRKLFSEDIKAFKESVLLDDLMKQNKIELHFYREGMILNSQSSSVDIMRRDFSVMGVKAYVLQLAENIRRSNEQKNKNGEITGMAPIGYENYINAHEKADESFNGAIIELFDIATDAGYLFAKSSELELKRFLLKFVFKELWLTEGKLTYELNFPFSEFETTHLKKIKTNLAKLTNPLDIKGLCGISNQTAGNDNQNSVELHISDKKNNGLDQKI